MRKHPLYAIVDIETTGTNPKKDRIIQFGCVLVEEGKVVSQFATDINPRMKIPKLIEELTGIKTSQVSKAPYFEDVAYTIYQLLSDCIFVAHNIAFDYQFLNHELVRCGVEPIKIPGIDTVELAQVFLPTASSYRLAALADQLEVVHDRPHQADSDAFVTAKLFIEIEEKMRQLPLVTLEKLVQSGSILSMQTGDYIASVYKEMIKKPAELSKEIKIVNGLALKRKEISLFSTKQYDKEVFPEDKEAMRELFADQLAYREEQMQMMNKVYQHFQQHEVKNLAIEAATGIGKTFGYLVPLSFIANPENPVVISTSSILLQNQLIEKDIPQLNQFLPMQINALLVKGYHHYIDLERFALTFTRKQSQKQYVLYQMKTLVWLTQTISGDLDELNLTNYDHYFWQEVRSIRGFKLTKASNFSSEDFVNHLLNQMKQANFIIVNHAFLTHENHRDKPFLPEKFYLVIDEAHHFSEIAQKSGTEHFVLTQLRQKLKRMREEESQRFYFEDLITKDSEKRTIRMIKKIITELDNCYEELYVVMKQQMTKSELQKESLVTTEMLQELIEGYPPLFSEIIIHLKDLTTSFSTLWSSIQGEWDKWLISEQEKWAELYQLLQLFQQQLHFFERFFSQEEPSSVKWFSFTKDYRKVSGMFSLGNLKDSMIETKNWYSKALTILYTGGTLTVDSKVEYLKQELGLKQIDYLQLPDPYCYEEQAKLFVPKGFSLSKAAPEEHSDDVAKILRDIVAVEKRSIMVLFTSQTLLEQVYYRLQNIMLSQGRELIAQGISGGKDKIFKRFLSNKASVFLGTDSFWEGIDLPGESLEILIVSRIPFEPPERPFVKAKYAYMESIGINAFYQSALPKAIMRLRQGLGRLIRSSKDRGVMIVLDDRLIEASYSKKILSSLPKDLPIDYLPATDLAGQLQSFFSSEREPL